MGGGLLRNHTTQYHVEVGWLCGRDNMSPALHLHPHMCCPDLLHFVQNKSLFGTLLYKEWSRCKGGVGGCREGMEHGIRLAHVQCIGGLAMQKSMLSRGTLNGEQPNQQKSFHKREK